MTDILWIAVAARIIMGAFDTIYHHEGTERLAWRPGRYAGRWGISRMNCC